MSDECKNLFDAVLSSLTLLGAVIGFIYARREWRTAQEWERAKICLAEIARLVDDPAVQKVCLLIDWQNLGWQFDAVTHAPDTVTDEVLVRALRFGPDEGKFSDHEVLLRGAFDRLFDAIARAAALVKAGLVDDEDLLPYLGYWSKLIHGGLAGRGRAAVQSALQGYMRNFGFSAALELSQRLDAAARREEAAGSRVSTKAP